MPSGRDSYWGGAAHCIPSHLLHCYKGNKLQFDNYWGGGGLESPSPPVPTGLIKTGCKNLENRKGVEHSKLYEI